MKNGYHGHAGSQFLTASAQYNHNVPRTGGHTSTVFPDLYRCPYPKDKAVDIYVDQFGEVIEFDTPGNVAAMICEPI